MIAPLSSPTRSNAYAHYHQLGFVVAKCIANLGMFCLLSLCLVEPVRAGRDLKACHEPSCGPIPTNTVRYTWSPTNRPEVLVTSWNTPVDGIDEELPAPDPEGVGPVTISLTETTIDSEFFGIIDLNIGGLSLGQTVRLEKFKVDNDQGNITAAAILVESYRMTDGVAIQAGGVFNFNLLNDVTPRDGQITGQLDFWEPDAASVAGEYVFRVSSPAGSFSAQTVRLTVTDTITPQRFTGVVSSGGVPLAGAIVALLDPLADTKDYITGTTSDANGNYTLYAPYEDEFEIVAFKPGYVGPFSTGTEAVIGENQEITIELPLQEGSRTISGALLDADSQEPLPGVQVFFFPIDDNDRFTYELCATTWTNAQGQFSASVTPGEWGALVRSQAAYKIGYVANASAIPLAIADATAADVSGFDVSLPRANSMIWGNVLSDTLTSTEPENFGEPLPLCGVEVYAYDLETGKTAWGVTDGDGCYRIAASPGRWFVVPYPLSLIYSDHSGVPSQELTLTGDNQSINFDFYCRPTSGSLSGFVTDEKINPIGGLFLRAFNTDLDNNEVSFNSTYASDGFYFFDLPDGTWRVYPDAFQAATTGLLFLDLPEITIENGVSDEFELDIDVEQPTATISVTLTDRSGAPVSGAYVHGFATVDGVTYDSFAHTGLTGEVSLPAIEGDWKLHFSANDLRTLGMEELPEISVTASGAVTALSMQTVSLTNAPAEITSVSTVFTDVVMQGTGQSGQTYVIESSTDLKEWFNIGSVRAAEGKFTVIDEFAAFEEQVFYRVITQSLSQ